MTTGKTIALTRRTFVGKVMSLLFNMLDRLVITFLTRSKLLLISWLQHHLQCIWSPKKWSLTLFPLFPHLFPMKWWDQMPWSSLSECWAFSLSSFTFIKRLFSSSSLSAIRMVSSAYLMLLVFLPAILIPACVSSSPAFLMMYNQFSSVQSLSSVRLFATPWTAACQASFSITNCWSSLKLMSIKLVMPSSHLILCRALFFLPPIPPSIRVFSNDSTLHTRWPKYWSFSFSIIPSKEHPGLISFRMDWLDVLAVQGTLKSLLQHHSSKASIL